MLLFVMKKTEVYVPLQSYYVVFYFRRMCTFIESFLNFLKHQNSNHISFFTSKTWVGTPWLPLE